jgi:4-hydroxythreonine-4-phosphate dehydrogenase
MAGRPPRQAQPNNRFKRDKGIKMIRNQERPIVALTMGDVAGIGPEVIAKGWGDPRLHNLARPLVVGDAGVLRRAVELVGGRAEVQQIDDPERAEASPGLIPCLASASTMERGDLTGVTPGALDPRAGRAAYEFLVQAIDLALAGRIAAITTLPISKKSLSMAGVHYPGHTEILADRCQAPDHAMMLYLATGDESPASSQGLGVVHVTLHMALRRIFDELTVEKVKGKIHLADRAMRPLTDGRPPRIAVAALNPHASEEGLFGDEEAAILAPAVAEARSAGVDVTGPHPADSLFRQALAGGFDAIVAMYHDQGHIPLKAIGFSRAVNVTLGLPIVRTSVAHGTAFDIAWKGCADPSSLIEAVRIAARIVAGRDRLAGEQME